VPNIAYFKA